MLALTKMQWVLKIKIQNKELPEPQSMLNRCMFNRPRSLRKKPSFNNSNLYHRVLFSIRCIFFVFVCSFTVVAQLASAQTINKQKLTVSYLYNFAKNVEWPNEAGLSEFNIGVYGQYSPALLSELNQLSSSVKLRNLPINVSLVSNAKALGNYQLIYLEQVNNKNLSDLYEVIEGKPVLVVTLDYPNKQWVMINLVNAEDNRLRFEVNNSNIINHGLKPLPELILNGGTEIDVAKLFREGQASLVSMQKQLLLREKTLDDLTATIQKQEALNKQLETQLTSLNDNIKKSNELIERQKNQLQIQGDEISRGNKARADLAREVEQRTQDLNNQQKRLSDIAEKIEDREKRLQQLNDTIKDQSALIGQQKNQIVGLDKTVTSQSTALRYSFWLIILAALLLLTIAIAYTIKRRDNQRLAEQTKDLQIARDRLAIAKRKAEDASQAKSEFLSLMSHELRTPLQAIIGYTEVVIEDLRFKEHPTQIKDLSRVIQSGERLLKLINGVLDLAKIESGRMEINLMEIKLSNLVDEALNTLAPLFDKNSIRINVQVKDGDSLPKADPEKILHILINLLGNACKFSPKGSVTIKAIHQPDEIYISVADTGIGLSPEQQLHIFEAFQQADSSITRKFQGSGLGLSITRQLCEIMGGSIRVESELGKGANFIVELPLPITVNHLVGASGVDRDAEMDDQGNIKMKGPSIVMVDDDPSFLDIMARTMRREGYHVHTAQDAETGLHLIQQVKPDVITLDLLLPDQHGWLLFEQIKAQPDLQPIPIIVISMVDERKNMNKHQVEEYLTKPIRRETLRLAVQKLALPREQIVKPAPQKKK